MAGLRCQVVAQPKATDVGADYITNVLWYSTNGATPQGVGDALLTAFSASGAPYYSFANVWVKVYDRANPKHSPPVYTAHWTGAGDETLAPRQVALCLSFYSGLNIKGMRGRIYVGPWPKSFMDEYAGPSVFTMMDNLTGLLKLPGGPDVVHQIHHVKTDTFSPVTNYFTNNRWDTMRSRLPKETVRHHNP